MRLRKNNVNHTKTQVRTHTQRNIYFHVIVMFTIVVIVITYYLLRIIIIIMFTQKKEAKCVSIFYGMCVSLLDRLGLVFKFRKNGVDVSVVFLKCMFVVVVVVVIVVDWYV